MGRLIFSSIMVVLGLILVVVGDKEKGQLRRLISATPTSLINEVKEGDYAEIKGTVHSINSLKAPKIAMNCVAYTYERKREQIDVRDRDNWEVIEQETSSQPFLISDNSGSILVNPKGATFEVPVTFHGYIAHDELLINRDKKAELVQNTPQSSLVIKDKLIVRAIPEGSHVYVLGEAKKVENQLQISKPNNEPFLISTLKEEELLKEFGIQDWLMKILGIAFIVIGAFVLRTPDVRE